MCWHRVALFCLVYQGRKPHIYPIGMPLAPQKETLFQVGAVVLKTQEDERYTSMLGQVNQMALYKSQLKASVNSVNLGRLLSILSEPYYGD